MILLILIIAHLLLDFTFQTSKLAERKRTSFKHLFIHGIIYFIGMSFVCVIFLNTKIALISTAVLSLSHFAIDYIRQMVETKYKSNVHQFLFFILDQLLHLIIIIATYTVLKLNGNMSQMYSSVSNYKYFTNTILYILLFVTIWDPVAVFIKKIFCHILNGNAPTKQDELQMGNIIGKLERVIISVLVLLNQYGAVGFVLTAKSIARYKQLEDKKFAEKYLVGTLASILISLVVTVIVKSFLN